MPCVRFLTNLSCGKCRKQNGPMSVERHCVDQNKPQHRPKTVSSNDILNGWQHCKSKLRTREIPCLLEYSADTYHNHGNLELLSCKETGEECKGRVFPLNPVHKFG
ncbi:hypothetical protein Y1Q_0000854 [Alligator mississippiensis]|uniref:Uncharacterized protein n=1 Tax=Alligator mississippiensis TaxID=8496 RepID=A0A151NKG2_ALLMI|nr:hypothetical protein Y1Q_0000854 [Alligator mississippiensis]